MTINIDSVDEKMAAKALETRKAKSAAASPFAGVDAELLVGSGVVVVKDGQPGVLQLGSCLGKFL